MAEQYRFWSRTQFSNPQKFQIVEHELDMNRDTRAPVPFGARLMRAVGRLALGERITGHHSRSIARELEDTFPSRDN